MDTTVRNLDEEAYRRAKARAALEGKNIGEVISEALLEFTRPAAAPAGRTQEPISPGPRSRARAGRARAATFVRPFPKWGPLVDNPMVVVELKD